MIRFVLNCYTLCILYSWVYANTANVNGASLLIELTINEYKKQVGRSNE